MKKVLFLILTLILLVYFGVRNKNQLDKYSLGWETLKVLSDIDSSEFEDDMPCKGNECDSIVTAFLMEAVETGDTNLYDGAIFYDSYTKKYNESLIFYSLIMAYKYNYAYAHYNVYLCYSLLLEKNSLLNPQEEKICNYHLLKSYELGRKESLIDIKKVFGDTIEIPNSKNYYYLN